MHTKVPAHCSADVCVLSSRKTLLRVHDLAPYAQLKTRTQNHQRVSFIFGVVTNINEKKNVILETSWIRTGLVLCCYTKSELDQLQQKSTENITKLSKWKIQLRVTWRVCERSV